MLDPAMNLWDVAALAPIIREAGGRLTTWEGEDRLGESAVASNGLLHAELMSVLRTG
jgi:histidinol-phosphatase